MTATRVVNLKHKGVALGSYVYVGRKGHGQDGYYGNDHVAAYIGDCLACWSEGCPRIYHYGDDALKFYALDLEARWKADPEFRRRAIAELPGRDLGCFCVRKDGSGECHAKILAAFVDRQLLKATTCRCGVLYALEDLPEKCACGADQFGNWARVNAKVAAAAKAALARQEMPPLKPEENAHG